MNARILTVAIISIAASGCAVDPSRYGEMTETGGVTALPLGEDRFKIEARGNGVTSSTMVDNFALLKAAETTRSIGATHFIVVDEANKGGAARVALPQTATTHILGNTAYTTVDQPNYTVYKPGRDITIKAFRSNPPAGALVADEIIAQLRPVVPH